jgi:hypothetical protein
MIGIKLSSKTRWKIWAVSRDVTDLDLNKQGVVIGAVSTQKSNTITIFQNKPLMRCRAGARRPQIWWTSRDAKAAYRTWSVFTRPSKVRVLILYIERAIKTSHRLFCGQYLLKSKSIHVPLLPVWVDLETWLEMDMIREGGGKFRDVVQSCILYLDYHNCGGFTSFYPLSAALNQCHVSGPSYGMWRRHKREDANYTSWHYWFITFANTTCQAPSCTWNMNRVLYIQPIHEIRVICLGGIKREHASSTAEWPPSICETT